MLNDTSIIHTDGKLKDVSPVIEDEDGDVSNMSTEPNGNNPSTSNFTFNSIKDAVIFAKKLAHPQKLRVTMVTDEHDGQNKLKVIGAEGGWTHDHNRARLENELIIESMLHPTEGAYQVLEVREEQPIKKTIDGTRDDDQDRVEQPINKSNDGTPDDENAFKADMDQRARILSTRAATAKIMGKNTQMTPDCVTQGFVLFMPLSTLKINGRDIWRTFVPEPSSLLQTTDPLSGVIGARTPVRIPTTRTDTIHVSVCLPDNRCHVESDCLQPRYGSDRGWC